MWWSKAKPDDSLAMFKEVMAQVGAIAEAEHAGRKAWRISVMNYMLAHEYRHIRGRRYRWNVSELSQLSGVEIERLSERHEREADAGP